MSGILTAVSEI